MHSNEWTYYNWSRCSWNSPKDFWKKKGQKLKLFWNKIQCTKEHWTLVSWNGHVCWSRHVISTSQDRLLSFNSNIMICPMCNTSVVSNTSKHDQLQNPLKSTNGAKGVFIRGVYYILKKGEPCYIWKVCFQNLLHPLLHVTHLQLRSQQRSHFSTQNVL